MPRRAAHLALAALALLVAAACDSTPKLTDFKAAATSVRAGDTLTLTAMLEDLGGDLDGGKQVVTLAPSVGPKVTKELPINIGGSASRASITLSIETLGIPRGALKVTLQVFDKQGLMSNLVETTVDIT